MRNDDLAEIVLFIILVIKEYQQASPMQGRNAASCKIPSMVIELA